MGLDKLNPFKKSQKSSLTPPEDDLQPTKSTSSISASIRSFGDKAEEFMSKGQKPRNLYETKDGHYDPNTLPISITTAGGGLGGGAGMAPTMSNGGGLR